MCRGAYKACIGHHSSGFLLQPLADTDQNTTVVNIKMTSNSGVGAPLLYRGNCSLPGELLCIWYPILWDLVYRNNGSIL